MGFNQSGEICCASFSLEGRIFVYVRWDIWSKIWWAFQRQIDEETQKRWEGPGMYQRDYADKQ